jgi:hypothetical protein
MTTHTITRKPRTKGRFDFAFGVRKVADRRWQVFADKRTGPGTYAIRPVGPIFKTQWEAAQQARHFSERREARFNGRSV